MLIYLEAARYKVQSTLAELDGRPTPPHPLANHIQVTRDRQGLQQSILKVPQWASNDAMSNQMQTESPDWTGREAGDGTSVQPDSDFGMSSQRLPIIKLCVILAPSNYLNNIYINIYIQNNLFQRKGLILEKCIILLK